MREGKDRKKRNYWPSLNRPEEDCIGIGGEGTFFPKMKSAGTGHAT